MPITIPPISLVELESRRNAQLEIFNTRLGEEYRGSLDNLTPLGERVKDLIDIDFIAAHFNLVIPPLSHFVKFIYRDTSDVCEIAIEKDGWLNFLVSPPLSPAGKVMISWGSRDKERIIEVLSDYFTSDQFL